MKNLLIFTGFNKENYSWGNNIYDFSEISLAQEVMQFERKFAGENFVLGYEQSELQRNLVKQNLLSVHSTRYKLPKVLDEETRPCIC